MTHSASGSRIIRSSDLWFAAGLLAAAAFSVVLQWTQPAGSTVVFRRDGEIVARQNLSENGVTEITGDYTNIFAVENGTVRVIESTCPNGACQHAGSIASVGASIICVPNHVSATIEGDVEGGVDAYTG